MKLMLYPDRIISRVLAIILFIGIGAETPAQNDAQKDRAILGLDFYNMNNSEQKLIASLRTRVEGFFQPVPEAGIKFYKDSISEATIIGRAHTNNDGLAELDFSWLEDTALVLKYIASLENHPDYKDVERDVEIRKSFIEVHSEEVDSIKEIRVFIGKLSKTGEIEPIGDVDIRIYVKRLFGLLPVSEEFESTDDEGYFDFEFPTDIPGDEKGNLTVVAQVHDHDELGNLEYSKQVVWGVHVQHNQNREARELWLSSSNVPNVLVITVSLLVATVVAILLYIGSLLVKIRRIGLEK